MATATSSHGAGTRRALWLAAALLALLAAGAVLATTATSRPGARTRGEFSWLRPTATPATWQLGVTASGARLSYPAGWRRIDGDLGSFSAAPPAGVFHGYLNATPKSGGESLANWTRFRLEHVADDGNHDVKLIAHASGLRFRGGHGSCVIDAYSTTVTRFREIACIVAGHQSTTVVVAAAPDAHWASQAAVLERAVASFGY